MTKLTKPIRRVIEGVERRGLVITLYPKAIGLRAVRTRKEHTVSLAKVYQLACEATVIAERKKKLERRNELRKAKGLPPIKKLVSRGFFGR